MTKEAFFTVLILLACCVTLIQGLPTSPRHRNHCFCRISVQSVNMDRVEKVEYYRPSSSCDREEVLVFLRNKKRRCLNLSGKQGRGIKLAIMEKYDANQRSSR